MLPVPCPRQHNRFTFIHGLRTLRSGRWSRERDDHVPELRTLRAEESSRNTDWRVRGALERGTYRVESEQLAKQLLKLSREKLKRQRCPLISPRWRENWCRPTLVVGARIRSHRNRRRFGNVKPAAR